LNDIHHTSVAEVFIPKYDDVNFKFSLPMSLCSGLSPEVRDRQTSDRQTDIRRVSSLNDPYSRGGA